MQSPYAAALLFEALISRALDNNFLIEPSSVDLTALGSKKNKKKRHGCLSADNAAGIPRPMGWKFASFFSGEHFHFRKSQPFRFESHVSCLSFKQAGCCDASVRSEKRTEG